jgi:hypothetical protein
MTNPNPIDYLKYVTAEGNTLLNSAGDQLSGIFCDHPEAEADVERIQDILDVVRKMLIEATATFCADGTDFDRYSDGRATRSSLEMETGNVVEYVWHPQHDHRINRPHTYLDRYECTSGARRSVVVSGNGVLDSVDHGSGPQLVDDPQDSDDLA